MTLGILRMAMEGLVLRADHTGGRRGHGSLLQIPAQPLKAV